LKHTRTSCLSSFLKRKVFLDIWVRKVNNNITAMMTEMTGKLFDNNLSSNRGLVNPFTGKKATILQREV
jgi:hypothetical protein